MLQADRVLRRPDTLTACERTYLQWQELEGTYDQRFGRLGQPYAAYVIRRGDAPREHTLATMLAPWGDDPALGTKILHAMFHDGPDPDVMGASRLTGTVYADEGVVACVGGAKRVAPHVVAGIMLTPELGGTWKVVRSRPDLGLLKTLRLFNEVVDPEGELVPQPRDELDAVRDRLLRLTPLFQELYRRGLRMPRETQDWLYYRPLDWALARLAEEMRRRLDGDRRARRPRRLSVARR